MLSINLRQQAIFDEFIRIGILKFHEKKYINLNQLNSDDIFQRRNLYLLKTRYLQTPETIVRSLINRFISSSDEEVLGNFLKKLAIYISKHLQDGQKSSLKGIDLEFNRKGVKYLIDIKSGPNWGNSNQIAKMEDNFKKASKTLQTSGGNVNARFINGCCYGADNLQKGGYLKLCGQQFWAFITGDNEFYLKIVEPLGFQAKERSEIFNELFTKKLIAFTTVFHEEFVHNGEINWNKLIVANSGTKK